MSYQKITIAILVFAAVYFLSLLLIGFPVRQLGTEVHLVHGKVVLDTCQNLNLVFGKGWRGVYNLNENKATFSTALVTLNGHDAGFSGIAICGEENKVDLARRVALHGADGYSPESQAAYRILYQDGIPVVEIIVEQGESLALVNIHVEGYGLPDPVIAEHTVKIPNWKVEVGF